MASYSYVNICPSQRNRIGIQLNHHPSVRPVSGPVRFPNILSRTHGRNGPKFCIHVYHDDWVLSIFPPVLGQLVGTIPSLMPCCYLYTVSVCLSLSVFCQAVRLYCFFLLSFGIPTHLCLCCFFFCCPSVFPPICPCFCDVLVGFLIISISLWCISEKKRLFQEQLFSTQEWVVLLMPMA